ncbi:MAG: hypothetical protein ACRDTE_10240 [Pseudonocardiaceae bacterium]
MYGWGFGRVELAMDLADSASGGEIRKQSSVLIPQSYTAESCGYRIRVCAEARTALRIGPAETDVSVPDPDAVVIPATVLAASRLAFLREDDGSLTFHATAVATLSGAVLLVGPPMAG